MAKISFFIGLLQFVVISMAAQYQVNWHNLRNLSLDGGTNVLTKTSSGQFDGGALSTNKLDPNTDGKITYVIGGNEHYLMFGFSEYNNSPSHLDFLHHFYLYGTTTQVLSGHGTVVVGDTLILERSGGQMIFRKHTLSGTQQTLKTEATDPNKALFIDVSIRLLNNQLNNMHCSFNDGLTIEQNILHHQNITNNTLGSIDINVTGDPSITYSWSHGPTTQDVTGLSAGTYTVTVTDGNNQTLSKTFIINAEQSHLADWFNIENLSENSITGILTKTSTYQFDGGALSTNKLAANTDGKITYVIGGNENYLMFGFSEYNEDVFYTNILYKFYLYGTSTQNLSGYGTVVVGDTLILERLGNQIIYRKHDLNGVQHILKEQATDPTKELYADVSIRLANNQLNTLHCSFSPTLTIEENVLQDHNTTNNTLGSIDINVTGDSPITYSWSHGPTTQDATGLSAGTYTITVTDGNNNTVNKSFTIKKETTYQVDWQNINNYDLNQTTNILTSNSGATQWDAGALSINKLPANTDGKITYIVHGNEYHAMIGLSEYNNINSHTSILHKFYIYSNTLQGYTDPIPSGTVIELERLGNKIIHRKLSTTGEVEFIKTETTDPTKDLYVDVSSRFTNRQINHITCSFYTPLNVPYHPLTYELIGGYYNLSGSELHFSYYQRYTPSSNDLNYEIIDKTNTPVSVTLPVIPVTQGENHLTIDFSTLGLASGYYTLKVTNEKNEVKQLRFKI